MEDAASIVARLTELSYAVDTFYLLVTGALVMWMAAGFTMLEAGLVRAKNTAEILTKNIGLYSVACIMYMLCGYAIMYPDAHAGGVFQSLLSVGRGLVGNTDHSSASVLASGGEIHYSASADFFFQVVFVATAMSIVSGAVAERMKLWAFLVFALFLTGFIYPVQGFWKWGGGWLDALGFRDFAGSGVVHLCGAAAALAAATVPGASEAENLRSILNAAVDLFESRPDAPRFILREVLNGWAHLKDEDLFALRRVAEPIVATVERGKALGTFRDVPSLLVHFMAVATVSFFFVSRDARARVSRTVGDPALATDTDTFRSFLTETLLRGLSADPPRPAAFTSREDS